MLTGWFLELERLITRALGGLQGTDLTDQQRVDSTLIFVDVNTVLLGALFLVALWALVRTPVGRPWDAMMLAASPCVAAAALINWDMLPIALTALGMACWSARRPGLAGVMLGLGAAAKLYPALAARSAFLALPASQADGRLRDDLVHFPGELGSGQPSSAVACAGCVAQLLGLQQRARRRPRLDLVRAVAGRPAGSVSQLGQRRTVRSLLPGHLGLDHECAPRGRGSVPWRFSSLPRS